MGKTAKDMPWELGGQRHRWCIVSNHGSHGKFTTAMRRGRRREEVRELERTGEVPRRSAWRYKYFD